MKKTFLIILFLAVLTLSGKSQMMFQPANDTIVFIVDTLQPFVKFAPYPASIKSFSGDSIPWLITIQCHYFDTTYPAEKESAKITLLQEKKMANGNYSHFEYRISKKDLSGKLLCVPDYWIQKQLSFTYLSQKIGLRIIDKNCNYVVFKNELDDPTRECVTLHLVTVGFYIIIN